MHLFVSSLLLFFPLYIHTFCYLSLGTVDLWGVSGQGGTVVYNDSQKNVSLGSRKDASD